MSRKNDDSMQNSLTIDYFKTDLTKFVNQLIMFSLAQVKKQVHIFSFMVTIE